MRVGTAQKLGGGLMATGGAGLLAFVEGEIGIVVSAAAVLGGVGLYVWSLRRHRSTAADEQPVEGTPEWWAALHKLQDAEAEAARLAVPHMLGSGGTGGWTGGCEPDWNRVEVVLHGPDTGDTATCEVALLNSAKSWICRSPTRPTAGRPGSTCTFPYDFDGAPSAAIAPGDYRGTWTVPRGAGRAELGYAVWRVPVHDAYHPQPSEAAGDSRADAYRVTSHNQQGGITAGVVNVHHESSHPEVRYEIRSRNEPHEPYTGPPSPLFEVIPGAFVTTYAIELAGAAVPVVRITAKSPAVTHASLTQQGGNMGGHGAKQGSFAWARLTNPSEHLTLRVYTDAPTDDIELSVDFR